jgi:flagellar hook-associated protein FlgK
MTNLGLDIGLRALLTSQSALDTIGHNIANASTPGYTRQSLAISSAPYQNVRGLLLGTGVQGDLVRRVSDELLSKRLVLESSGLKRLESRLEGLSLAQVLFGQPGSDIGAGLQSFFGSVSSLSTSPADPALRDGVLQSGGELSSRFNELHQNLESLRQDSGQRVFDLVEQVNELARRVAELNSGIVGAEAGRASANDLRDQRDLALRQLSELVGIRYSSNDQGAVRVLIGGHMLVSPAGASRLEVQSDPSGALELRVSGSEQAVPLTGGAIGGLLELTQSYLPGLANEIDQLARSFLFEVNRAHSTGVPAGGPFSALSSEYSVADSDGDGETLDELLANAGLPFAIQSGELYVNVTDRASGALEKHRLEIDAQATTVGGWIDALNAIPHFSASLDSLGRLQLSAEPGFGFDFSRRVLGAPDLAGSFGGGRASLATPGQGPFALAHGDTLALTGPSGSFAIAFDASDFANIAQASAGEIAAVINADSQAQSNGIRAAAVGGALVLQSTASGAAQSFTVDGGSALSALGLQAGTTVTGSDTAVSVEIGGSYAGAENRRLYVRALGDGEIGATPGLEVEVQDEDGNVVATLEVGAGYRPNDELAIGNGLSVRFGPGAISSSDHDVFALDTVADSDTTDILAAFGLNALFTGTGAADLRVRESLQSNPTLLSTSASGAPGDGGALLDLLALSSAAIDSLGGLSFEKGYSEIASGIGLEVSSATSAVEAERFLVDGLQARRDQIAGVNVDEELVQLIEYEQAFAAASRYLGVVSQISEELLSIL